MPLITPAQATGVFDACPTMIAQSLFGMLEDTAQLFRSMKCGSTSKEGERSEELLRRVVGRTSEVSIEPLSLAEHSYDHVLHIQSRLAVCVRSIFGHLL